MAVKNPFVLAKILCLACLISSRAEAQILRAYWEASLKNDEEIQEAVIRKRGAEDVVRSIPGNFSPRLTASAVLGRQDTLVHNQVYEPLGIAEDQQIRVTNGTVTVEMNQNLWNNPLNYERSISQKQVDQAQASIDTVKKDKVFQLIQVFFEAMRLRTRIDILNENRKLLVEQRKLLSVQVRARLRTRKDIERYNMLIDQRKLQINQTLLSLSDTAFQLKRITRLKQIAIPSLSVWDTDKLFSAVPAPKGDSTLPAVRLGQATVSVLNEQINQVGAVYKPTFSLFVASAYNRTLENTTPFNPKPDTAALSYGLRMDWLILDSYSARINQSKLAAEVKRTNYSLGQLSVNRDIEKKRWLKTLDLSKEGINSAKKLIRSSNYLLQVAEEEAKAGLTDLDLAYQLRSSNADNELALVDAIFSNIIAWLGVAHQSSGISLAMIDAMDRSWFRDPVDEDQQRPIED